MTHDVRWKQRFHNFGRAVVLLREPIEQGIESLSDLEREGAVRRFEFALELARKIPNDYIEHEGTLVQPVLPVQLVCPLQVV